MDLQMLLHLRINLAPHTHHQLARCRVLPDTATWQVNVPNAVSAFDLVLPGLALPVLPASSLSSLTAAVPPRPYCCVHCFYSEDGLPKKKRVRGLQKRVVRWRQWWPLCSQLGNHHLSQTSYFSFYHWHCSCKVQKNIASQLLKASLVAQMVKNPPAMHKTWVYSLQISIKQNLP